MSSTVLNVRQIAQYPGKVPDLTDLVLLQTGGLGGPYASALVSDLINAAFNSGAVFQLSLPPDGVIGWGTDAASQVLYGGALGGALGFSPSAGWRWDYANPSKAVTLMRLGPDGNLTLELGTLRVARGPAFPDEVMTLGYFQTNAVTSFNGRTGDVVLGSDDVYDALQLHGTVATQEWVNSTITASLASFYATYPLVQTFNGRFGIVTLTADDITAACTAPGAAPQASSPALGDASSRIATTLFVDESLTDLEDRILGEIGPPDLSAYAPLASPQFSGIPTAPTPNPGTSTGQLATTAFVQAAVTASTTGVASFNTRTGAVTLLAADITGAGGALLSGPVFTGVPSGPTASPGTNTTQLATTAFVQAAVAAVGAGVTSFNGRSGVVTLTTADVTGAGGAPIAGPTFTGTVRAPTASPATNDTTVATTAYVTAAIAVLGANVTSFNGRTGAVTLLNNDISAAGGALIASPAFTGTPTAPTAVNGTSTTQLATCAFVLSEIAALSAGVTSFNTRTGAVTLVTADITGAGGAPVASPALTGIPTAPTAVTTDSSTTIATTAFVKAAIGAAGGVTSFNSRTGAVTLSSADVSGAGGALISSPTFTGTPAAPTAAANTSTTQLATTAFVMNQLSTGAVTSFNGRNGAITLLGSDITSAGGALLASPTFTGTPNAPTATAGTSNTQIATTAFVQAAVTAGAVTSFNTRTGAITLTSADITSAGGALLASPTFTGTPAAPTAVAGTNTTQLATTAFVHGYLPLTGGTLTGSLAQTGTAPSIALNKSASAQASAVYGQTAGSNRWAIELGNATAETGSNAGSNFTIDRYNDAGTIIDSPLTIARSTGAITTTTFMSVGGSGIAYPGVPSGTNGIAFAWTAPLTLYVNGTSMGTIAVTSDYRTKKDVTNLSGMWETVRKLRPVKYTQRDSFNGLFAADNKERWGFLAHELQEAMIDDAASGVKDGANDVQSPNPWTVIAALTKALQEAMFRIEALEAA